MLNSEALWAHRTEFHELQQFLMNGASIKLEVYFKLLLLLRKKSKFM